MQRNMSSLTLERPKMTVEMWESLKGHIMKQREKRKQEQEQDAAIERHRREQELKRKRDAMTLEDIKDQLTRLEVRLKELKDEKHEFFLQLKKVLNEDETRKRQRETEIIAAHQAMMSSQSQQPMAHNPYHPYPYMPSTLMSAGARPPALFHRMTAVNTNTGAPIVSSAPAVSSGQLHVQTSIPPQAAHSISSVGNNTLKRVPLKRPHERSPSPPLHPPPPSHSAPNVPYSGIVHNYKTSVSYTPSVPKTTASSGPFLYYQTGAPPQMAYDAKGNPYHILPSGAAFPADTGHDADYEAKYYQQLRGMGQLSSGGSSIIPIQQGQAKPGGITSGFPVQRSSVSNPSGAQQVPSGNPQQMREPPRGSYHRYY